MLEKLDQAKFFWEVVIVFDSSKFLRQDYFSSRICPIMLNKNTLRIYIFVQTARKDPFNASGHVVRHFHEKKKMCSKDEAQWAGKQFQRNNFGSRYHCNALICILWVWNLNFKILKVVWDLDHSYGIEKKIKTLIFPFIFLKLKKNGSSIQNNWLWSLSPNHSENVLEMGVF